MPLLREMDDIYSGNIKRIIDMLDENELEMKGTILWSAYDVQDRAQKIGYEIPDDSRAQEILEEVIENHDAECGICWVTFDHYLNPIKS